MFIIKELNRINVKLFLLHSLGIGPSTVNEITKLTVTAEEFKGLREEREEKNGTY